MTAATPKSTKLEKEAAAYRAIAKILPDVLQRGALAALDEQQPSEASGLSWINIQNADLLDMHSDNAKLEKMRRSMEAVEVHNLMNGRMLAYAPTPALLASLAGVEDEFAAAWLARRGIAREIELVLAWIRIGHQEAASFNAKRFNQMIDAGTRKPDPRSALKWDELKYGEYEW